MARFSIILIFMIWLSWSPAHQRLAPDESLPWIRGAIVVMGCVIVGIGLYSRGVSRRMAMSTAGRDVMRFNKLMRLSRFIIPAWFAGLVFGLDFPAVVARWSGPIESAGFLLGTFPAALAWMGLWWAAYPAERAIREQCLLAQMEANIPIRFGPTLWQHIIANLRLQFLFMLVPVLCILVLRDVFGYLALALGYTPSDSLDLVVSISALIPVMLAAPILLVRVLPTSPMPDSPLRQKLEELCRRNGLRARMLLWRTNGDIGNAAVMGILPQVRYLLVTDLLLETMSDEQILAIFAHEIGHVRHRHLLWMAVCALCMIFALAGPGETLLRFIDTHFVVPEPYGEIAIFLLTGPLFLLGFGMIVRRFERQADVFAARMVPALLDPQLPSDTRAAVEPAGASLVSRALHRVALINNVPVNAHEWLHGSIGSRMRYLHFLGDDPVRTHQFDGTMKRIYQFIVITAIAMAAWTLYVMR